MSSRLAGPRLENEARKFWLFVSTSAKTAPFAVALVLEAAKPRTAPRSDCPSITAGVVGWSAGPARPLGAGSPAELVPTKTATAPAVRQFAIMGDKAPVPG